MRLQRCGLVFLLLVMIGGGCAASAEDGSQGWLRYAPPLHTNAAAEYQTMPAAVVNLDPSPVAATAQSELMRGVRSMLDRTLRVEKQIPDSSAWVLGTTDEIRTALADFHPPALRPEGFSISTISVHGHADWIIAGADARGVLYGVFHVLSGIARGQSFAELQGNESPAAPVRWVNQWDNLNGRIERGYGGRSIFFENGSVREDLGRVSDYGRLLASIGINGCTVNNVNADPRILTPELIGGVARIADAFRPWGVRVSISVPSNAPQD
ncbi:MAG TPA: alpha-glucuronidase family glycosyl hydrolase, partial [Acidobacteriaceae bacterium]|nr:alpha-glucuronidase family glycosyl hydrolase [Acidobacteriaceae bacterium]